jgi:hypothetical protein
MSLAEEMLANMSVSDDSASYLTGQEGHIVINESRTAIVPAELKTIAVTGDKDIETVTFDCVRYWDGNDLSTFAIYLNYVLPDKTVGTYIPEAITTSEGEGVFHFDWKIKNNITTKSGKISFAITAIKTKQNENGETVVDKQWGSLPNGDCSIALGLDITNVPSEEESSGVVAQLSAILEKIHSDVDEWIKTVLVQESGNSTTKAMSQKATTEAIAKAKNQAILYTDEKKEELNSEISRNYQLAIKNSKRLTNLELGASETFEIDSSVAYVKDVPSASRPYAKIIEIGGMTYKEGDTLKSAPVTEVESVGANIWDEKWESGYINLDTGIKGTDATCSRSVNFISVEPSKTYYMHNGSWNQSRVAFYDNDEVFIGYITTAQFVTPSNCRYIRFYWSGTEYNHDICINKSDAAINGKYYPYVRHTLPIPEAVQALDGYGEGVNESVYNYIDYEKKQFVKRVGKVDMGTLTWAISNGILYNSTMFSNIAKTNSGEIANILCAEYQTITTIEMDTKTIDKSISYYVYTSGKGGTLKVYDSDYTAPETFKAAMSGVMLYYELATPEVTDISDILSVDNYIEVEGGGSLTFENEYKYDVPSAIKYQVGG